MLQLCSYCGEGSPQIVLLNTKADTSTLLGTTLQCDLKSTCQSINDTMISLASVLILELKKAGGIVVI